MSEIRPTNNRPEAQRPPAERPVKTEYKAKEVAPPKIEARQEVVKHEMPRTEKIKGGNVDITV